MFRITLRITTLSLICFMLLLLFASFIGSLHTIDNLLVYFQRDIFVLDINSGVATINKEYIQFGDSNPLISPDNKWRLEAIRADNASNTTLNLINREAETTTVLGTYDVFPLNPLGVTWLNDDTVWVLAVDLDLPRFDTLLLNFDLHTSEVLTEYRYNEISPQGWVPSSNGKFLMLIGPMHQFPYQETYVIELGTGDDILGGLHTFAPRWSPDGDWLAYEQMVDGQRSQQWINFVTGQTWQAPKDGLHSLAIGWSPDSQWTIYENVTNGRAGLDIMNVETGQHHTVLESPYLLEMQWSPNSKRLLIREAMPHATRLWMSQNEHKALTLIDELETTISGTRWSSDEDMLAYHLRDGSTSTIHVFDVLTGITHDVWHTERVFRIEWQEGDL